MWAHKETAKEMTYGRKKRWEVRQQLRENGGKLDKYDDVFCGRDFIKAGIGENDTVLLMSFDGAQLYQSKLSDVWIYI